MTMAPDLDPGGRGELDVSTRALRHLVEGVIDDRAPEISEASVEVVAFDPSGAELEVRLTMAYPEAPLSTVLTGVRRTVASETSRLLGRPVHRVDLRVTRFAPAATPRPPRVV